MTVSTSARPARLERPREGRSIAGVCAGFAQHYGWDPILVRLVLSLAVIFGFGSPIIAYLFAWVLMPNGPYLLPSYAGYAPAPAYNAAPYAAAAEPVVPSAS